MQSRSARVRQAELPGSSGAQKRRQQDDNKEPHGRKAPDFCQSHAL
jgi:hypothetical protein